MKYLIFIYIALLSLASCSNKESVEIEFIVNISSVDKLVITTPDNYIDIQLDEFGMATSHIEIKKACFASVYYGGLGFDVFLSPGKDMSIKISQLDAEFNCEISCDDGGISNYLVNDNKNKRSLSYQEYKLDEADYIQKINELLEQELNKAKQLAFSEDFNKLNLERVKYDILYSFGIYPQYHSYESNNVNYLPGDTYIDFANKYFKPLPELYGLSSYISYMDNIAIANANKHIIDWDSRDFTVNVLNFIQEKISDAKLKDILITKRVNYYLTTTGLNKSEEFIKIFRDNVKDKYFNKQIEVLIKRLTSLEKGSKSHAFKFKDIDSNTFSLEDFKAKYTYIYVWASWCSSCKEDLIVFNDLQNKFKDKNISFVSLSLDNDKAVWKRNINELNLSGIQLNYDRDIEFMEDYMIYYLPRYILLDKNGNIFDARAISARSKEVESFLNSLPSL